MSNLKNTGIVSSNTTSEYLQLSDGSAWFKILNHDNKSASNLFTSSNCSNNQSNTTLYSRLYMIPKFISTDGYYEFLCLQPDDYPTRKYRWKQTSEPTTTTSVVGFAAVDGYTSPNRGICKCSGCTYLAHTNSTSDWWGACGSYTSHQGGIPGIGSVVVYGLQELYIRVDNTSAGIDFSIFTNEIVANNFIEY